MNTAFDTIIKAINTNGESNLEIINMLNEQRKDSTMLRVETKQEHPDKSLLSLYEAPPVAKETKEEPVTASPSATLSGVITPSTAIASAATPHSSGENDTQKIFGKLPPELMNRGLTKPQLMRLSVIYEMIETEVDYIRDLNIMINVLFSIRLIWTDWE